MRVQLCERKRDSLLDSVLPEHVMTSSGECRALARDLLGGPSHLVFAPWPNLPKGSRDGAVVGPGP